jgi:hypothetical protein
MAEPGKGLIKPDPNKESHIGIALEPGGKGIKVSRETFWVSKSKMEVAEWFCLMKHVHGKDCFTVEFDKEDGSPFTSDTFTSDENGYRASDYVKGILTPDPKKTYKYTITVGSETLDPKGGVRG